MKRRTPVSAFKRKAGPASRPKAGARATRGERVDAALGKLSKLTKALEVGASGIGAAVAYHTLVPEQLSLLGAGAFLIGGLGVVTSWLERRWLRRHAVKIVLAAVFLLVSLLLLNLRVVEKVHYTETASGKGATSHLLVGTTLTPFG